MFATRLYSRARPGCRIFGLIVSESVVAPMGSVVVVRLVESVGTATATVPVTVSGRNQVTQSGRSPKPLPILKGRRQCGEGRGDSGRSGAADRRRTAHREDELVLGVGIELTLGADHEIVEARARALVRVFQDAKRLGEEHPQVLGNKSAVGGGNVDFARGGRGGGVR